MANQKIASVLITTPELLKADRLKGWTLAQIRYAITMYKIEPAQCAGRTMLWDDSGIEQIRSALKRIG